MSDQPTARTVRSRTRPTPTQPVTQQVLPPDLSSLFGSPLIPGEDAHTYEALLAQVTASLKPADVVEEFWVRDVVDSYWDSRRLRRLKDNVLVNAQRGALERLLELTGDSSATLTEDPLLNHQLASGWLVKDENATVQVQSILDARGLDINSIMAQALSNKLNEVERLDRLIASAEFRRNKALTELERHRDSLARRSRMTTDNIIDID